MVVLPDVEEHITTFDGLRLHSESFAPAGPPRAAVVMVHGFSAHCGAFRHVAGALAAAGFAVTAFDCRGHGRSQGRHGFVRRFTDYTDDLHRVLDHARRRTPGVPAVVAGHSHGVAISLDYLLRELTTADGAFASSQDADTEGIEGLTFTWRAAEIREVLGDAAPAFTAAYGVTEDGNWEGVTILSRQWPAANQPPDRRDPLAEASLAASRARLLERRATRPQPARASGPSVEIIRGFTTNRAPVASE